MTKERHGIVARLNDRSHVFGLPFQFVPGGVAALTTATTLNYVDRTVIREGGTNSTLFPESVNIAVPVYEYKRWSAPCPFERDLGPIG
jgi:hypothetical protein